MYILSIREPYATLYGLIQDIKQHETRDWSPRIPKSQLPADVLIHASRSTEEFYMLEVIKNKVNHPRIQALTIQDLEENLGKIISLVKLVDYVQMTQKFINKQNFAELSCGYYATRRWAWVKGEVFPLPEKIPHLGKPWLEDASNEIIANVTRQLEQTKVSENLFTPIEPPSISENLVNHPLVGNTLLPPEMRS